MRYAWTPKFQLSGPTVHSYTVPLPTIVMYMYMGRSVIPLRMYIYVTGTYIGKGLIMIPWLKFLLFCQPELQDFLD